MDLYQTETDKYHTLSFICGISKKNVIQMNLFRKEKQTHVQRNKIYSFIRGRRVGEWGGIDWEHRGIDKYTQLYLNIDNQQDLLSKLIN